MKTCCICGEPLPDKTLRRSKWKTCDKLECRKEARRLMQAESRKRIKASIDNPTGKRLEGIARMKEEIGTQENFAKAIVSMKNAENLAKKYGISIYDVGKLRKELFGEMKPKLIHNMGRELLREKEKPVEFERRPIPVTVYRIIDIEAFEAGGMGTYDGLKFDRMEYADETKIISKSELVDVSVM